MPARGDPIGTNEERVGVAVELERYDRGAAYGGASANTQPVIAPGEMLGPVLGPRVEERDDCARARVDRLGLIGLMRVADRAGQPEIGFVVAAATGEGNDVLDLQAGHDEVLWTAAVPATMRRGLADSPTELGRNGGTRQRGSAERRNEAAGNGDAHGLCLAHKPAPVRSQEFIQPRASRVV